MESCIINHLSLEILKINICIENINFEKDDPKGAIVEDNCICVVNTLKLQMPN